MSRIWKTESGLLACVGPGQEAEHVVRSAARFASQLNVKWHAVYVETPSLQRCSQAQRDRTLAILKMAEDLQAKTAVLTGGRAADQVAAYARTHNLSKIMIGRVGQHSQWQRLLRLLGWRAGSFSAALRKLGHEFDFIQMGHTQDSISRPLNIDRVSLHARSKGERSLIESLPEKPFKKWGGYLWALGGCVLATLIATPLYSIFDLANIVMVFLMAVVLVALKAGRGPAMLAAFLNVACFDVFFVPPRFSFAVSDVQYILTFVIMLVVGVVVVDLAARLVIKAGEEVHLTPIEYRLLGVLIANAGKVLTQRQLLKEVWGDGYLERPHYLRVHMGHLRQKLETKPSQPEHLLTEVGVGYRLLMF